jgi:hypothetical protein
VNGDVGEAPTERDVFPDPERRAIFASVAQHLIPAAHGMASAGDVVDARRVAFVLGARPDLAAGLWAALRPELGDDPAHRLSVLAADHPDDLAALQLVVVGGYYTDSAVRAAIGYPGQLARPVNAFDFPDYIEEGLIDGVVRRGPIWRDPSVSTGGVN